MHRLYECAIISDSPSTSRSEPRSRSSVGSGFRALILDGNSEWVAHAWWKGVIYGEQISQL